MSVESRPDQNRIRHPGQDAKIVGGRILTHRLHDPEVVQG